MKYLAIGNDELGEFIKEGDVVKNKQGKEGIVENSSISPTGMYLQFITIGEIGYLVGIKGRAIPGVVKI